LKPVPKAMRRTRKTTGGAQLIAPRFDCWANHRPLRQKLPGKVVSIADGATITVLDADTKQTKVRPNGIDAPERKQAFGSKSKARLGDLVATTTAGGAPDRRPPKTGKTLSSRAGKT